MNCWHQSYILSLFCGPRRKGAQRQEDCNMREARRSTSFKYTTWVLAMQCGWTLMSIRTNYPFHGVVNGGVTPIVVTNLVCVPKKKEFVQFSGSRKGAWKHIRTLEWKSKNRCNSSYSGNEKNTESGSSPTRIE
ncbi:uncharacterized protein DS421_1g33190 [Arachis hypogaea]|nr:uncharacterized protein DS421_1g33190 [Arachis hypogaea]